jgi:SAM-dependent methyltransferase
MTMTSSTSYSEDFYSDPGRTMKLPLAVLPIVFDLVKPKSVIDVGCGIGRWLAVARQLGAETPVGLEGPWAKEIPKQVDQLDIKYYDLEKRIEEAQQYDLAICMEVAEHLSQDRASSLVADLCRLSNAVLFSAAIPSQGGVNHVNEQWQHYWAELFASQSYSAYDVVRPAIWDNTEVEFWYRQNSLLYLNDKAAHPLHESPKCKMVSLIHPEFFHYRLPRRWLSHQKCSGVDRA